MPEDFKPLSVEEQMVLVAKHEKLLRAVARMRHFQISWEEYYARIDKEKKRQWEREVDKQIYQEIEERKKNQLPLFT